MQTEIEGIRTNRKCPKCRYALLIDTWTHKVFCGRCGYIEPCHLRGLVPSEVNCSSCPYSPNFKGKTFGVLKEELIKKISLGKHKALTLEQRENLEKKPFGKLKFPLLSGKCYQVYNSKRITRSCIEGEDEDAYSQ